jgi:hypothetical protein
VLTNKCGRTTDKGHSTILKAHPELAQVHNFTVMLIIIPVKLVDSNSSTQGTKKNIMKQTNLDKSTSETKGAQLHMMTNNPVKFHDSRLNAF